MNLLINSTDMVLKLHSADALLMMIKSRPVDATLVAVNQFKCASIFYKTNGKGLIDVDFNNGRGWESTRHRSVENLFDVLSAGGFVLGDLALLEIKLKEIGASETNNPLIELKQRVDAQFVRVDGRRQAEGNQGYWQGHYDAYEIVKHMIGELT